MEADKQIRVVHIIDSLNAGGAEQMAVNIVNGLVKQDVITFLIVTRTAGLLASKINNKINLYILNKKNALDFIALINLYKIVKKNKINIIHAHSTSIIWASLIKIANNKVKIIWHDHYGNSEQLNKRPVFALKLFSKIWAYTFSVNIKLKDWAIAKLKIKPNKIEFLNNFASLDSEIVKIEELEYIYIKNSINLVCVANLRPQKDHKNLLDAFAIICKTKSNVLLHLIGVDPNDTYSKNIINKIKKHPNNDKIYYWGAQQNIGSWLSYMQIGILPSLSEGLPVALLEYGNAGINVVSTNVGQISEVLDNGKLGCLVTASDSNALANGILETINNSQEANNKSILYKKHINNNYSEYTIIKEIINTYKNCLKLQ